MPQQTPLQFVFYFAAPPDKVWEGFVSPESNRIIFTGAELEADLKPGGSMNWVGTGADGKRTTYVRGEVLQSEPPKLLRYTFALGPSSNVSRVTIELVPETEATVSGGRPSPREHAAATTSAQSNRPRIVPPLLR